MYSRSSSGSPSTIPTETAATEPVSALPEAEAVERAPRGDVRAADRGAARAAVGLQHVAVEVDRPLAERLVVRDGANRAADQALDLDRPPALLAPARLALDALAGRRRQERVLGRHPAAARVAQPARHALLDRRGAEHDRLSLRPEHGAVRLLEVVELDRRADAARSGRRPSLMPPPRARRSSRARPRSIGSCRKRAPIARNVFGSPVVRKRYAPSRAASFSMPLRASVSATSRAVSSAEKTSVTPRPNTRCRIGRISG